MSPPIHEMQPEIDAIAKRIIDLVYKGCVGNTETEMLVGMGIVIGALQGATIAELKRRNPEAVKP